IVHQPILVMLIDPGSVRHLERSSPNAQDQAICRDAATDETDPIRELHRIARRKFAARVLVAIINLEELVAELEQMLGLPSRVGQTFTFVDAAVIGRPTPPSDRCFAGYTGVVQPPNDASVGE